MLTNVLNLNDSNDGNRIKQGDLSHMRYILTDDNKVGFLFYSKGA